MYERQFKKNVEMLQESQPPPNIIHESMCLHNLFLLLCLSTIIIIRIKKPLVGYSQWYILNTQIFKGKKNMNKVVAKEIKEGRQKEKEVKWLKEKTTNLGSTTNQIIQRVVKKCAQFIVT